VIQEVTMHETLVIAPTTRIATHVGRWHYLKWHLRRPGDLAVLADEIQRRVAAGAERVWW
jgi:hypothetical protein